VKEGKRGDLGAFTLSNGVTFRGKVLDAKGKPLAGVNVNAETMEPNEELAGLIVADAIRRSAVTDDKGEFAMAPLPPGAYRVRPDKHSSDSSKEERKNFPMPDVFVNTKVVLKEGAKMEPVEIRAVPSVVVEMQYYDSKGKPTRGHECHVFGRFDNDGWFGDGPVDANGKMVARIPHGLEQTQINLMTNEHGVLRHRLTKNDPLKNSRQLVLGTVTEDIKGIEIIRYVAPILAVNVKDKDGRQIKDFKVKAEYGPGGEKRAPGSTFRGGVEGDVFFEKQEDGRWRSSQLFPDEEVTLTASADGYESKSMPLKLTEGETKDIDFVLEKK
jgi:Carboxypeptidase regulatory-like domain